MRASGKGGRWRGTSVRKVVKEDEVECFVSGVGIISGHPSSVTSCVGPEPGVSIREQL